MGLLSFLKQASVETIVEEKKKNGGTAKQRNPNPAVLAVRVWKDGSVYPSQAAVDKFNLEYQAGSYKTVMVGEEKDAAGQITKAGVAQRRFEPNAAPGFGFDVIDSRMWTGYKGEPMLFLGLVPKTASKVDLFSSVKYDANGKPTGSVMDQGAATFGKDTLLPALESVFNIKLGEDKEYVDMLIVSELEEDGEKLDINATFSKPITYAPKKIVRGADQGKPDYVRRENMPIFAFIPEEVLNGTQAQPEGAAEVTAEETQPELQA